MTQIKSLTAEQQAQFKPWVKKWIDIGLSTEPTDFDKAKVAILKAYEYCKLAPPKLVITVDSPMAAHIAGPYALCLLQEHQKDLNRSDGLIASRVQSQVVSQVLSQIWFQVVSQILPQIRSQVVSQVWPQISS